MMQLMDSDGYKQNVAKKYKKCTKNYSNGWVQNMVHIYWQHVEKAFATSCCQCVGSMVNISPCIGSLSQASVCKQI